MIDTYSTRRRSTTGGWSHSWCCAATRWRSHWRPPRRHGDKPPPEITIWSAVPSIPAVLMRLRALGR